MSKNKEYKISINPRILELLGPSLYTNIYYVLAELIANAYDADAKNVYIISTSDCIIVEDDGKGMSYESGDIKRYLDVAAVSRSTESESITSEMKRKKMGRKGVGKLAALSVSETVLVKTIVGTEKSGFILTRNVGDDNLLVPIKDDEIVFSKVEGNGTSVVMKDPQYKLHSTLNTIKKNILRIFPLVDKNFRIHIQNELGQETIIDSYDKEIVSELAGLIVIGDEFEELRKKFNTPYKNNIDNLLVSKDTVKIPVNMANKNGEKKDYTVCINGWVGVYRSTRGRKVEMTDFPDNFLSLYANKKLGEFNILPSVGQNKLNEVYIVGQLHIDNFELTELPDMALSNRQGYKTDDPRYQVVMEYVREELLPEVLKIRNIYADLKRKDRELKKIEKHKEKEEELKESVNEFRNETIYKTGERLKKQLELDDLRVQQIQSIIEDEINANSPDMGIKSTVDSQKKKILISQTYVDKDLADIVYAMLLHNSVPPEDIIYSSCDDEVSRIPEGDVGRSGIYDYLRDFFVKSYSTEGLYVLFITSHEQKKSWGALTEVGAAWITEIEHKIFNIHDFRPEHPLDDEQQWHNSFRDENNELYMSQLSADIFSQKIEYVCRKLGYTARDRADNLSYLESLVKIESK